MLQTMNFPKVELHLHLDGAIRYQTLLDLAIEKNIDLHGAKTAHELSDMLMTREPANLVKVLEAFYVFMPCILGDPDGLERIAYELCEDQAKDNVVYFEARYSPHFLCNTEEAESQMWRLPPYRGKGRVNPAAVVQAISKGFERGEKDFGVKARSILCCIRGHPDWNHEILELAKTLQGHGVVGIDVAGCAHGADEDYEGSVIEVFQAAEDAGIHRTVHAGESGGPNEVRLAVDNMKAERIGHGYRVMRDEAIYQKYAVQERVHFEACLLSGVTTGSVPLDWPIHPVKRWADDNINFSLSTDDPTCFGNTMGSEMNLAHEHVGLTIDQLWQCQLNAAKSCFLPEDEKAALIRQIENGKPS